MRHPDRRVFNERSHQATTYDIELAECRDRLQANGHCIEGMDPEDIFDLGRRVTDNVTAANNDWRSHFVNVKPGDDELDRAWFARNLPGNIT